MPDLSFDQTLDDVSLVALAALHTHTLDFNEVCAPVVLDAMAAGQRLLSLNQQTAPATLTSHSIKGRAVAVKFNTAEAKLTATITLGPPPVHPEFKLKAKLYNLTGKVLSNGGAILCFVGPPWKTVEWRIVQGHGTLTPFTSFSDELGRCSARFDAAGFVERVVIGAAYVP